MSAPVTYGVADVVEMLGGEVSPSWVREEARKGRLPHIRAGYRSLRFTQAHMEQILELLEHQPGTPSPLSLPAKLSGMTSRSRARRVRRSA